MAMGIYGATIGIAVAIGPLVGGLLTDGLGWEWVFLINVPIGIAAIAVTYWKLAESRDPNATRIDWGGLLTFSSALFLLVLGLVRGNDEGWGSAGDRLPVRRRRRCCWPPSPRSSSGSREPMLPLSLFRRRAFTGVQLAAFAVSGSMFALFLYLTLYLQSFLGYSPIDAGLRYLPITIASFIVAPLAGMALAKVQARWLMSAGLALTGVGLLLMGGLDVDSEWTALLAGFIVSGIGVGLLNPVIADVALSVVPKERSGMAAGINDTFRQVGIAVGIAAWGAIFLGAGASKTQEVAGNAVSGDEARGLVEATSSGALPQALAACRSRLRRRSRRRPNRASCTASTRSSCSAPCSPSPARSRPCGWSASATSSARRSSKAPRSRPSRNRQGHRPSSVFGLVVAALPGRQVRHLAVLRAEH